MGLFRKKGRTWRTKSVEGHDDLVAVHENDLDEFLESFAERIALSHNSTELDEETERWLGHTWRYMYRRDKASEITERSGNTSARLGYFTRREEFVQLDVARNVCFPLYVTAVALWREWSREADMQEEEADLQLCLIEAATRLAREQPLNPGADDREALMWAIPGVGAEARSRLAEQAILTAYDMSGEEVATVKEEAPPEELARVWMAGFIFRHLHELFDSQLLGQQAEDQLQASWDEFRARPGE